MFDTKKYRETASIYNSSGQIYQGFMALCDEIDRLQSAPVDQAPADTGPERVPLLFPSQPLVSIYGPSGCTGMFYGVDRDGWLWLIEGATMLPVTVAVDEPSLELMQSHGLTLPTPEDEAALHRAQSLADAQARDAKTRAEMEANQGKIDPAWEQFAGHSVVTDLSPAFNDPGNDPEPSPRPIDTSEGAVWKKPWKQSTPKPLQATVDALADEAKRTGYDHDGPGADDGGVA